MAKKTDSIANSTTKREWREAVIQYFEVENEPKESDLGISIALRSVRTLSDWASDFTFLATVLNGSDGARNAMVRFIPDPIDYTEMLHYYMSIWHFPREVVAKMEDRLYAAQEAAAEGSNLDLQVLTSVAVTRLGSALAAEKIVKFIFAHPKKNKILEESSMLDSLIAMGELAEEALIDQFLSEPLADGAHEVMRYITGTHSALGWRRFKSAVAEAKLKNFLETYEPIAAVRAVYLVYLFRGNRKRFSRSLHSLLGRLDRNDTMSRELVQNILIYTEMTSFGTGE